MTIKTNYFDGQSYAAVDDVAPWASLLTDGVFNVAGGALAVSQYTTPNLSVNVAAGNLIKNGYFVKSDAVVNVPISANSSGYNRIDIIVANIDTTGKVSTIIAVAGTPSSSPTAPLPTANQLVLAQVFVGNNVSAINNANITDVRVNVDILGGSLAQKAAIAQPTWIVPTLINSWVNNNPGSDASAGYFKDNMGIVHLEGVLKGGTSGTNVFVLPAGYRPLYNHNFIINAGNTLGNIYLKSDGSVYCSLMSAGSWICISGISFRAEQ